MAVSPDSQFQQEHEYLFFISVFALDELLRFETAEWHLFIFLFPFVLET